VPSSSDATIEDITAVLDDLGVMTVSVSCS